ncbi:MAG TPA: class B sortase [Firmicutes bacterium]|nr:class B sortase [Bacillota bacterium]
MSNYKEIDESISVGRKERLSKRFVAAVTAAVLLVTVLTLPGCNQNQEELPESSEDSSEDPLSSIEMSDLASFFESSEESAEPSEESSEPEESIPPVESNLNIDFDYWTSLNPEVKGWIKIPGTVIDYPIVQSAITDQHKYLYKDIYGNYSSSGTLFFDAFGDISKSRSMIIYGHSQRDGSMFRRVLDYTYLDYYKNHPIIEMDTIYEPGTWKVFAVFWANTLEEHGEIFEYHLGTNFDESNVAEYEQFLNDILIRSQIVTPVDVRADDKIILLSTCAYEMDELRTVLVARKVRPGESTEVDVDSAYKNPNAKMPDIWYTMYGGAPPEFPSWVQAMQDTEE